MKKKIVVLVSLLVLVGIGVYLFVDYQKKMQEEQAREAEKAVEEAIAGLYVDDERAEFIQDIGEADFEEIRKKISKLSNDKSAKRFSKDLDDVEFLWHAWEKVQNLLEDGVLVEAVDEKLLTSLTELITEVKEINLAFAEQLNKDVEEIKSQYESLLRIREEVYALFADEEQETMKKEVTRAQYEEVKSSLEVLLNEKEKSKLQDLLGLIDAALTKNEEAEKKRIEAEKKMAALTVGKAKEIGTETLEKFLSILNKAGEENGWHGSNPGVHAVVEPRLLEVVTKRHSATLSSYIEEYYCECDSIWLPYLSEEMIRYELSGKTEDSFVISAIEIIDGFFQGPAYKLIYTFKNENGVWKLDDWDVESLEGKNLALSMAEVKKSWANYGKVTDMIEYDSEEIGELVYQVQFDSYPPTYISMKSGQIIYLD